MIEIGEDARHLGVEKSQTIASGESTWTPLPAASPDDAEQPQLGQRVDIAHRDFPSIWTGHPDGAIDVAAAFLGPFLIAAQQDGKSAFFRAVTQELCPTDEIMADLDVLEPVVFVGYPNALYDKANLTPIIRQGTTAAPMSLDYDGRPQFLIDASVFPGSSGSPVFIYNTGGYRDRKTYRMGQDRILFAGILAAVHIQADTGRLVTAAPSEVQFDQMLDLGIVFNYRAVIETVTALSAAHNIPHGGAAEGTELASDVEITETAEVPEREPPRADEWRGHRRCRVGDTSAPRWLSPRTTVDARCCSAGDRAASDANSTILSHRAKAGPGGPSPRASAATRPASCVRRLQACRCACPRASACAPKPKGKSSQSRVATYAGCRAPRRRPPLGDVRPGVHPHGSSGNRRRSRRAER